MNPKIQDYYKERARLVKRPAVVEAIGHDHQHDCAWWHGKPCNCQPVRVVIRGRRIIREVRREN